MDPATTKSPYSRLPPPEFTKLKYRNELKREASKSFESLTEDGSTLSQNTSVINNVAKIIKNSAQYAVSIIASEAAQGVVTVASTFSDVFKSIAAFKATFTLVKTWNQDVDPEWVDEETKRLNRWIRICTISSAALQILAGGGATLKILTGQKLVEFAKASVSYGGVAVAVAPLGVVTSFIDILKGGLDIAMNSLKIHKSNKKIEKLNQKIAENVNGTPYAKHHISEMTKKDGLQRKKCGELATEIETSETELNKLWKTKKSLDDEAAEVEKLTRISGCYRKYIEFPLKRRTNENEIAQAQEEHNAKVDSYNALAEKLNGRTAKFEVWKKVAENPEAFKDFIDEKKVRWGQKIDLETQQKILNGISIAISCAVIVCLVAGLALTFTGFSALPLALTLTTAWLLIAGGSLFNIILKEHIFPKIKPNTINFKNHLAPVA